MRYWHALSTRDRAVLLAGTLLVAGMLFWAYVWEPLGAARADWRTRAQAAERDLEWMRSAVRQANALKSQGSDQPSAARRIGQSLLALVDGSAREHQLGERVKRIEPEGEQRVRVFIELADFDQVAGWMENLESEFGVQCVELWVERTDPDTLVNLRATFEDARP